MSLDSWQGSINTVSRVLSELVREENAKIAEDDRAQSNQSLFYGCLNAAKAAIDVHPLLNIVYIDESLEIPEARLPAYQERVSALKEKGQNRESYIQKKNRKNPSKSQERTFCSEKIDSPRRNFAIGRGLDEANTSKMESPKTSQPRWQDATQEPSAGLLVETELHRLTRSKLNEPNARKLKPIKERAEKNLKLSP
ncbi:Oidioi.mRNA.OKI2018_I69.PAR.g10650.t1.cds [Oikopleura dioica]|uniref:Oidioi.mRNA.OKI2018_I69.PAR.g10650.t1.cds n=1 Tax=Oikopleura dioica TaxID=34765 RepID=A0ABN7RVT4_OIKDI|nr:Oidioi.mRNA.OKI2018_I69.PAR.g10650.t1.cds [Oikopleura dioica]